MQESKRSDRVVERIYVKGILKLKSPCLVGSGENNNADIDFVRKYVLVDQHAGISHASKDVSINKYVTVPYIPGTSLAGVFRNYLSEEGRENKLVEHMFGKKIKGLNSSDATISKLYVYDADMIDQKQNPTFIRDGVKLDPDTKTSVDKGKYDYEIVSENTEFSLRLELVLRECDPIEHMEKILYHLLKALQDQKIFIGAKKQRGFGRIELQDVKILRLDFRDPARKREFLDEWIKFDWKSFKGNTELEQLNHQNVSIDAPKKKVIKVKVPLKNEYSLMIRDYRNVYKDNASGKKNSQDYMQLCSNGMPVIPGTSWAGAIRARMRCILKDLYRSAGLDEESSITKSEEKINDFFGFVDESKNIAKTSKIRFYESKLDGGTMIMQNRIKIDRYTGGTVRGALFNELPVYHGHTDLVMEIEADENEVEPDLGLLLLALKDLMNGYLSIGGETNIGKGIFSGHTVFLEKEGIEVEVDKERENKYLQALYALICNS
ncbi:RAMP superfamily CRISPR-associated protein [Caldibacillus debilis]|uniref:RAMP superfamily CRISPR-associated protein n=1 Tax=Caldibacillus debilis TaxID=301148 RepID=UPI000365CF4F|nr:RAMP superfamily CRISPR-associated protein [Caldibacillus debilis]